MTKNKQLALELYNKGLKERALVVLRRHKCLEEILKRTETQLMTLEGLVHDIEYTQIEVSVVEGLKVGSEALKQLNSLMNIDDIQQMMEDNAEAAEKQREIDNILSKSSVRLNEDDLLAELESLKPKPAPVPEKEEVEEEAKPTKIEAEPAPVQTEPDLAQLEPKPAISEQLDQLPSVPETLPKETTKADGDEEASKPKKVKRRKMEEDETESRQLEPAQ